MLECVEDVFYQLQQEVGIPHEVVFEEEIVKIAAGTRFALVIERRSMNSRSSQFHTITQMRRMFTFGKLMNDSKLLFLYVHMDSFFL